MMEGSNTSGSEKQQQQPDEDGSASAMEDVTAAAPAAPAPPAADTAVEAGTTTEAAAAVGEVTQQCHQLKKPPPTASHAPASSSAASASASATASITAVGASASAKDHGDDESSSKLLALRLRVLDQLTQVYGFDMDVCENAIDNVAIVGDDSSPLDPSQQDAIVVACCDFLLDSGQEDHGGPVTPIDDCPHVRDHVKIPLRRLPPQPASTSCTYIENGSQNQQTGVAAAKVAVDEDGTSCPGEENWLCLECGAIMCSRYVNGHGLQHYKETAAFAASAEDGTPTTAATADGHCVAASCADLSVWCYKCNSYIKHNSTRYASTPLHSVMTRLEKLKFGPSPPSDVDDTSDECYEEEGPDRKKARETPSEEDGGGEVAVGDIEGQGEDEEGTGARGVGIDIAIEGDEDLVEVLKAAAAARGIPLEWILEGALEGGLEEEEEIEYPFESLPTSLEDVAKFIQSDSCKSILILTGAGMSVASGIPDFRSADGLYATMDPDLLTASEVERCAMRVDPTVALDRNLFLQNPLPCLELNREFILGTREQRWKATLAHRFVELLHSKTGKLVRLYTQNIDGLEDQCTQLPRNKVIAVHGSMDRAECAMCESEGDMEAFSDAIKRQIKDLSGEDPTAPTESSPIVCRVCGCKTMKPAIVLFRSSLPKIFFDSIPEDVKGVDLLIIIGTSLQVAPANSLIWRVPKSAMRVLVNREPVGLHLGLDFDETTTKRDYFADGNVEDVLLELMDHLGWIDDLEPVLSNKQLPESSLQLLEEFLESRSSGEEDNTNDDSIPPPLNETTPSTGE